MEYFYIVDLSNGKASSKLTTMQDVGVWIVENAPEDIKKITVTRKSKRIEDPIDDYKGIEAD